MFVPARSKTDMSWVSKPSSDPNPSIKCVIEDGTIRKGNSNNQSYWAHQSEVVRNKIGGSLNWGNNRNSVKLNYLGRIEGQVGGGQMPIRNNF
tara:strand:- start:495 stop:773 length:279 start_codon:yes stop_codon:yes gene_type:complete